MQRIELTGEITMERLTEKQAETGKKIEQQLINFRKDSASRKTPEYLSKRLINLEECWTEFSSNNEELQQFLTTGAEHPYFKNDYFSQVEKVYNNLKIKIMEMQTKTPNTTSSFTITNEDERENAFNVSSIDDTNTNDELERLVRRQRAVMNVLTRTILDIESKAEDYHDRAYYDLKMKLVQDNWTEITRLNRLIWEHTSQEEPHGYKMEDYFDLDSRTQDIMITLQQQLLRLGESVSPVSTSIQGCNPLIKLPRITLPSFDGSYLKWNHFHDLYIQLIHSQNISKAQKMFYLTSNLSGEAKSLIQHLPVCESNYDTAWDIIKSRYDNKRLLCTSLLNKFLTQPNIQQESAASLKNLHDTTKECILGLSNMGISTNSWDPLLVHLIIKRFDKNTHSLYEQSLKAPRELPSLNDLLIFLENRFQSLEALGRNKQSSTNDRNMIRSSNKNIRSSVFMSTTKATKCVVCQKDHPIYVCEEFLSQPPSNRFNLLKRNNVCINCMKEGHSVSQCPSKKNCTRCSKRHNTLLHVETAIKQGKNNHTAGISTKTQATRTTQGIQTSMQQVTPLASKNATRSAALTENPATLAAHTRQRHRKYVLLGTVSVELTDHDGNAVQCRAILDSGSQLNFITESLAKRLGLQKSAELMCISGIGEHPQIAQHRVNVRLRSRINGFSTRLEAFILTNITAHQPERTMDIKSWPIPNNIQLADPDFNQPGRIDLLIGAELYYELMAIGQIKLGDSLPTLQNTVFGWVIAGAVRDAEKPSQALCGICSEDERMDQQLEKFWQLEEFDSTNRDSNFTTAERKCINHFNQNVKRNKEGRFIVKLPFVQDSKLLGHSEDIALKRFLSLERKFSRHPNIKAQYVEFINEYIRLGHMKEVKYKEITKPHYFLPHHCVTKPDSTTTKLRVVFDASAKTSSNISLNDILGKGPTIQDELFSILIRFRMPRFVFTADIEKMYRQVLLDDEDQVYQLIIWRENPDQALKYYKLCTVTYGITSAPFLATRCLESLADTENIKYPLGSEILKRDFYVDDVMSGSNSLVEAKEMQRQLKLLLQSGGFNLRKWCANHPQLLQNIPREDIELELDLKEGTEAHTKTLGVTWLPTSDVFSIKTTWTDINRITKRTVLADIAHIFDPLGFVNPVTVTAKMFIQKLWALRLDWDAALPMEMHTSWLKYREGLKVLNDIKIPRHVSSNQRVKSMQIHAFSDASEKAYGAAVYVRSISQDGVVIVRLLCAKSKVAPIKTITLPRLELCAAKLATQLAQRIVKDLKMHNLKTYFWTDSEVVLAWINSESSSFHTFIANRVASIQRSTDPEQWRHVKSHENPADIVSRGIPAERLEGCSIWFYGPPFLHGSEKGWPDKYSKVDTDLEKRKAKIVLTTSKEVSSVINTINYGNSFRKLQRILSYVLRFIHNTKQPSNRRNKSTLMIEELQESLDIILTEMQQEGFNEDLRQIKQTGYVSSGSSLSSLCPFLDERGIIRVGGRLEHSNLSYEAKHPVLLPYSHKLTKLIMTDIHVDNLHAGPQALLAITRQRFWPLKGKTIARSIVQNCVRCSRVKPKLMTQLMGNLPPRRVQPARPFINSGVDFCGPIWTHFRLRGKAPQKSYIAVFCCFATKATHLEIVSDLTTEAFLRALKRFIARRGYCKNLYCDNATNFVGARNQLTELQDILYSSESQEKITSLCQKKSIEFHFIPPRAPHFGGLWEAAVKSAKGLLTKAVASAPLTYDELATIITEVEAVLNSRPITPLSADPNDLSALTPGHFLIGEPLTSMVDPLSNPQKISLVQRAELISRIKNKFWQRWSNEYLSELQHRHKWKHDSKNARPGMMVLIKEDNLPPLKWKLGRIVQVIKGSDGLARVADVRTTTGTLRRPIHNLAPLPINDDPTSNDPRNDDNGKTDHTMGDPSRSSSKEDDSNHEDSDPIPTKRIRSSTGSAMSLFLLTCLIIPVLGNPPVEIIPFQSQPGIHFENLGTASIISNEWNLIVYYDMKPYWQEFDTITNSSKILGVLCNLIIDSGPCTRINQQFQHLKEEIISNNELLSSPAKVVRRKRAPLNIIGNVASSLFGVLDSEYAEKMSHTIEHIETNEHYLLELLKNQTVIIDSTMNIIKKNQRVIDKQFQEINEHVNEVLARLTDITQELQQQKLSQQFNALSVQLMLITSKFQRTQASILDALINTHHGKISPQLLSPQQLKTALVTIKGHLPPGLRIPAARNDMRKLYKLMTIEAHVTSRKVIFRVKLPLLALEEFELYRIIPVPVWVNNSFVAIQPSSQFLVINLHRDQYYPLSEQELVLCTSIEEDNHLCKQRHPIYRKGASISNCEIELFNHSPRTTTCKMMKIETNHQWIQLYNPNQWIYTLREQTPINVVCGNNVSQLTLENSGILKLQGGCSIKQKFITIKGHNIFPSSSRISYTPSGNLSEFVIPDHITSMTPHQLQQSNNMEDLETLKRQLNLQKLSELPAKIRDHALPHITVGYTGLLLTIIIIVCLVWKHRFKCCTLKSTPSQQDFTVKINTEEG